MQSVVERSRFLLIWGYFILALSVCATAVPAFAQRSANFNHNATGFILDGVHASLECRDCHRRGAPKGLPRDCNACHVQGGLHTSTAQMVNHIPTSNQACSDCHNQSQWTPALMRHTVTMSGNCVSCHNGAYASQGSRGGALGKPTNHPLTNASCDVCHAGTMVFSKVNPHIPNNTAMPGSCSTCHGVQAIGKPATHIPTTQSCDVCHTNFMAFKPAQFQHDASTIGNCSSCHNGVSALGKPAAHIPTASQCDTCHTSQISFLLRTMNHAGLSGQCSTCHGGAYVSQNAQAKTANHFVTSAQCDTCHTSTTTWATSTYVHALPANAVCDSCHNGTPSSLTVIPLSKPASHIPTSGQCSTCHPNFVAFKPAAMNHTGLTGQCSTCHSGSYTVVNAQAKSAAHIPTARQCDSCHNNFTTFVPARMDHTGLNGQCISCHTGAYLSQNAQVKTPTHQPTTAQCDTCHVNAMVTLSWATSANPHIPVNSAAPNSCGTCHGITAIGKPTSHVPTTGFCDTCHTNFVAFKPAQMNHGGTSGLCTNCHSGSFVFANAQAKNAGHIPTSRSCDACHTNFVAFKPAAMDHTGTAGICSNCHSGSYLPQNAQQKGTNHVPTATQCDTCHLSTTDWGPMGFIHTATSLTISNNCRACHTGQYLSENAQVMSGAHVATGGAQCDSCHTTGASSLSWATTIFDHQAASPPTPLGVCNSCHKAAGPGLPMPGTHIPTATQCDTCHRSFTAFRPAAMNHTAEAATACATCHGGGYTAVNAQTNVSPPHIPLTTGTACNKCHTDTVAWANRAMDHTGYTRCTLCHGGAYVSENAQKQGTNHIQTGSSTFCSDCHAGFNSWSPAQMDHTKVSPAIACSTCHNGSKLSENAQTKPTTHIPTTAECNSSGCHNVGFTSWRTSANPHLASPPMTVAAGTCATCHYAGGSGLSKPSNHIPTTLSCDRCHTNFVAFKPAAMSHTGTSGQCLSCHNGSYTFAGTQGAQPANSTHIPTTAQCDNCHNTVTFKPANMNHANTAGRCSTCHNGSYLSVGNQGAQTNTSPPHVPVAGAQCDTCHLSTGSWAPMMFLHTATSLPITSNCRACHSGQYLSENAQVQTNIVSHTTAPGNTAQCDTCHLNAASTLSWATGVNPHIPVNTSVAGSCTGCHGGGAGMSKPTSHIPVTDSCDVCHSNGLTNFTAFKPAQMNHSAASVVASGCITCHATGKSYLSVNAQQPGTSHIPIAATQCSVCHTSPGGAWTARTMDHTTAAVAGATCPTCHAAGKPYLSENAQQPGSNHIAIGANSCSKCHTNYNNFSPAVMDHSAIYPSVVAQCKTCHNGSKLSENAHAQPANHGATGTNDCNAAGCHVGYVSWSLAAVPSHSAFAVSYGVYPNLTCDSCHNGTQFAGVSPLPKPGSHIPTSAQCSSCHPLTVNPPPAGSFKPARMNHAAVTGPGCSTCHNGAYAFANALPQGPTHIPTTALCSGCHTRPTAIGPLSSTLWVTPRAMNHTLVSTTGCSTCHSGGYLSENAQHKSGTHIPTTEQCDACHTNPGSNPSPLWAPVTKHTNLGTGKCQTCHIAAYTGAHLLAIPGVHIPTISFSASWASCDACHKTGYYTAWANDGVHKAPASRPAAEVAAKCGTCHTSPNAYGIKGPQSVTPHNATKPKPGYDAMNCTVGSNCHKATKFTNWSP